MNDIEHGENIDINTEDMIADITHEDVRRTLNHGKPDRNSLRRMGQFRKVLLAIDKVHTIPHRALNCGPGLGGLDQVYGPSCPTPSVKGICGST